MDPSWELAQCSLFFYVMVIWCGHKRRHGTGSKQQFITVTGHREGWSLNAEESHGKCQICADGRTRARAKSRSAPLLGSAGKARQGEQCGIGWLNNFGGLEDTGLSLSARYLALG